MKTALLSVSDKQGIESFAKSLTELGYRVLSTGGTYKAIETAGVPVTEVSEYTEYPEILDGRVKTLHPKVHGGLLYKRGNEEHEKTIEDLGISSIDLICVNLYPFEENLKKGSDHNTMIENIDIGGPTMIRAAAKNYKSVYVVTDPKDYDDVIEHLKSGKNEDEFKQYLGAKAFTLTSYYDSLISRYLNNGGQVLNYFTLGLRHDEALRYGENPHQKADLYTDPMVNSYLSNIEPIQGKALSFNNINDLNLTVSLAGDLYKTYGENVCVAIKHATPCGVAIGENGLDAYQKCYEGDPVSIFGGIVAIGTEVTGEIAEAMSKIFLEVIAAPSFSKEALEIFAEKKNLRLLEIDFNAAPASKEMKLASGKVLIQDADQHAEEKYEVATEKAPTEDEKRDLIFGMIVAKYTKSNAIVIVRNGATLGINGGQTSRIAALENIFNLNKDKDFEGSVLASDAFFPFDDCVRLAAEHGVKGIIQPGGSIRDEDSVEACNELGLSMVMTGVRHFLH